MTNLEKLIADNKWRPIEEAPRDGTEIELLVPLKWGKQALSKKEPRVGTGDYHAGAYWWDSDHYYWTNRIAQLTTLPTHFRPLPDDRLAKCAEVMMGVIWKVIDNVPLTLQEAQEYLDEALTECEKIAEL